MHPDILAIRSVWKIDHEMDQLKAEARKLAAAIEAAKARIVTVEAEQAAQAEQVARLAAQEAEVQRKLDDYTRRRDKTRALINAGTADYAQAQRQLEQCIVLVDQFETEVLGLIEQREAVVALQVRSAKVRSAAQLDLEAARKGQSTRRPEIEARFKVLEAARPAAWAGLVHPLQAPYNDLRRRGKAVQVDVVDGVCPQCHHQVGAQVLIEVARGRGAHACRGCGAWLHEIQAAEEEA